MSKQEIIQEAADNIRCWLVQSYRYTASTFELNDKLVEEVSKAVNKVTQKEKL
jgi:hypothetical protein